MAISLPLQTNAVNTVSLRVYKPSSCIEPSLNDYSSICSRRVPSLWAATGSIAPNIGYVPQTLNEWVKRDEIDTGTNAGVTTTDLQRLKELERENKELCKANDILKVASAFFAQTEPSAVRRLKS